MYKPGDFSFNNTDQQAVLNETYRAISGFRAWQELSIEFGRDNFHIDHISFKMIKLVYIAVSEKFGHAACRLALRDVQSIARFGWEAYVARHAIAKQTIDLQEPQCVADDEDDVFNTIYEDAPVMTRSTFVTGASAPQALACVISHIDCDDPICY